MTKILKMTRSLGRAVSEPVYVGSDPLEPTQPLSPRTGNSPFPLPAPFARPWFPAALVLRSRPEDLPRVV
jgi:hypothetical protein